MSRSRRNKPITGITTAENEAFEKAKWHRAHRRAENARLQVEGPTFLERSHRENPSPWTMEKDGKRWWGSDLNPRYMRK